MFLTEKDDLSKTFQNDYLVTDVEQKELTLKELNFVDAVFDIFEDIIEENDIDESFTSSNSVAVHFYKHCLAGRKRKSKESFIYYDYNHLKHYMNREAYLDTLIKQTPYKLLDLYDVNKTVKLLRKVFEGNKCISIEPSCGLYNNLGTVSLAIHSWANDATTNYFHNTIDFIVRSVNGQTITLYPIDALLLLDKLNSEFKRCGFAPIKW